MLADRSRGEKETGQDASERKPIQASSLITDKLAKCAKQVEVDAERSEALFTSMQTQDHIELRKKGMVSMSCNESRRDGCQREEEAL